MNDIIFNNKIPTMSTFVLDNALRAMAKLATDLSSASANERKGIVSKIEAVSRQIYDAADTSYPQENVETLRLAFAAWKALSKNSVGSDSEIGAARHNVHLVAFGCPLEMFRVVRAYGEPTIRSSPAQYLRIFKSRMEVYASEKWLSGETAGDANLETVEKVTMAILKKFFAAVAKDSKTFPVSVRIECAATLLNLERMEALSMDAPSFMSLRPKTKAEWEKAATAKNEAVKFAKGLLKSVYEELEPGSSDWKWYSKYLQYVS